MKVFPVAAALIAASVLGASAASGSTALGAGAKATADGSVLVSHSCRGWYDHRLRVVPGGDHSPDETVEIYNVLRWDTRPHRPPKKVGQIPQAARTYSYFQIGYPFMNQHQVTMAQFAWGGREELQSPAGMFYIENLQALGLARAATAREAVQVIGELAERYGYADVGQGLVIGDALECWVLEICGPGLQWRRDSGLPGAHWVAQRVPDDGVFLGADSSRIGEVHLGDQNFLYSSNLTDLAKAMGWWSPGQPFRWNRVMNAPNPDGGGDAQERQILQGLARQLSPNQPLPFAVVPQRPLEVQDLMGLQGASESRQEPEARRCSYSFVAQSRRWLPDPIGGVLWFGLGDPDTTVYAPIYSGATQIPQSWSQGQRQRFDESPWWAFQLVNRVVRLGGETLSREIQAQRAQLQHLFVALQPQAERHALELYRQDPDEAAAYLTRYSGDGLDRVARDWWNLAWRLVIAHSNSSPFSEKLVQYLRNIGLDDPLQDPAQP